MDSYDDENDVEVLEVVEDGGDFILLERRTVVDAFKLWARDGCFCDNCGGNEIAAANGLAAIFEHYLNEAIKCQEAESGT